MPRLGPLFVALILSASAASAQPAPVVIRGRVVADDNNRPLRRALVTLAGAPRSLRPVLTDEEGRFEITGAPASLTIGKAGFAATNVAATPRASTSDRELVVRMTRGGVISGRVIDSNGEVAFGMKVVARLEGAAADGARSFETEADDLGEYRIAGLPAGRYSVLPSASGPRVLTAADTARLDALMKQGRSPQELFQEPSVRPRSADVRTSEETGGIDFSVRASDTIRALIPVRHRIPVMQPLPDGKTGRVIGPPLVELRGGSVMNVGGEGLPRSLDITVSGGGVVSGSIVDSAGEPFQGITVRALEVRRENGRMVAHVYGWPRVTDDRGRYRLFGLAPGSYLIVASIDATEFAHGGSSATGFPLLYFPGTPLVEAAQTLRVEAGTEVSATDLTFAASPVLRLTGTALNAAGEPHVGRVLFGVSQRSGAIAPDPRSVPTAPDGSFEVPDVVPGDYVVQAMSDATVGGPPEFGSTYVTIADRDPPPLMVTTSRGATLEGRFVVEEMSDPPMRALEIHAAPTDLDRTPPGGRGPRGLAVNDDGRCTLTGLFGPIRLTLPDALPGLYLKSVTIGGVDTTDLPFDFGSGNVTVADAEIVLSNTGATIAGSLTDGPQSRASGFTVVAFSTRPEHWFAGSRHVQRAASGPNGSFDVKGLPPGEYFVAAVEAAGPADWQEAKTLQPLVSSATRMTVREREVATITLRLVRR